MNSKSKIQTFFNSKQEDVLYIEKYEENIEYFNDLLKNGHKEDIEFVLSIKIYHYTNPLIQTGNYSKACKILAEIETDLDKLKAGSKRHKQYLESYTFLKGVCLGRLKKYKESNIEFAKALRMNPKNDRYIEWYKSNKKHEIGRISGVLMIFGVSYYILVLILDFTGHRIEHLIIRESGFLIALLAILGSYFWKKLIDKQPIKLK